MQILFIGGTGNISGDCAATLQQQGHDVVLLTRGRSQAPPQHRSVQADRNNLEQMRGAVRELQPDVVVNFLGFDVPELETDYAVFARKIRQYIFISSATVYAKPPERLPITEDARLGNAFWEYAQKKLACEEWLRARSEEFPVTIVRPSHTYSKAWIPNAVASSSYTLAARMEQGKPVFVPDSGDNPWTLTATTDFAVGLAGLVGNQAAIGEAFHITSDEVLTWNQIYAEIASALGIESPNILKIPTDFICEIMPQWTGTLKGDKAHPGVFDNSKIKRFAPGFACRKTVHDGIRESVAWLRAHPEKQNLRTDIEEGIERVVQAWRGTHSER
jgi:nucleoside-diphosphate-sugar epimerase